MTEAPEKVCELCIGRGIFVVKNGEGQPWNLNTCPKCLGLDSRAKRIELTSLRLEGSITVDADGFDFPLEMACKVYWLELGSCSPKIMVAGRPEEAVYDVLVLTVGNLRHVVAFIFSDDTKLFGCAFNYFGSSIRKDKRVGFLIDGDLAATHVDARKWCEEMLRQQIVISQSNPQENNQFKR